MAAETPAILAEIPGWAQSAIAIALFFVTGISGLWVKSKASKEEKEKESHGSHDADDFLDSSPIRKFLESVNTIADNQRIQTEALKTISAAATTMAKTIEGDFDERRIQREVDSRIRAERNSREARS